MPSKPYSDTQDSWLEKIEGKVREKHGKALTILKIEGDEFIAYVYPMTLEELKETGKTPEPALRHVFYKGEDVDEVAALWIKGLMSKQMGDG